MHLKDDKKKSLLDLNTILESIGAKRFDIKSIRGQNKDQEDDLLNPDSTPESVGTKRVNKLSIAIIGGTFLGILTFVIFYSLGSTPKTTEKEIQKFTSAAYHADKIIPKNLNWVEPSQPVPQSAPVPIQLQGSLPDHFVGQGSARLQALESAIGAPTSVELKVDPRSSRQEFAYTNDEYNRRSPIVGSNEKKHVGFDSFESRTDWDSHSSLENPTKFILRTGSVIPGVLLSGINSELPGKILAQVAQDVYDSPSGQYLLIPKGSRLIGEYSSEVAYGQSRVLVAWQRIVYPDGRALDLGVQPGADAEGYGGFKDRVDSHWARIFGSAVMMSAVVGGVAITQNLSQMNGAPINPYNSYYNNFNMTQTMSQALGTVFGNLIAKMLEKNLDIAPTLKIRKGYRFNILVVRDFNLFPYKPYQYSTL